MAPYLVLATAQLGVATILEASLGFLGVGIPPPTPTWGNMLGV
jgi:ABC-type dipeptide/oligopeptide/nickel transport system permease subunit